MSQAVQAGSRSPENVAWCLSEMGDMLFKTGRIADAEYAFRLGLKTFLGYHRAHAGLGRAEAAQGRLAEAIGNLKKAQAVVPLPEYAGLLEALYEKSGDRESASRQRRLIDAVDTLMTVNGEKANRNLALLYADSDRNLPRALQLARAEFEVRNDVYSYDALSWALYKNGEVAEAAKASQKAVALGTPEPAFYFHAGMIALANGDREAARRALEKAVGLNPSFDVRNAPRAQSALSELSHGCAT
jgi:tetratricopeptide (TPR) repeat protein